MKRCPTCSRVYDDVNLRFCFDDGTELVNKLPEAGAPETLVLSNTENQSTVQSFEPPPPPRGPVANVSAFTSPRQRKLVVWILVIGFVLPFIAGGAAGVWVGFNKDALTWHLVLAVDPSTPNRDVAVTQSVAVIQNRLDALAVANFQVRAGEPGTGQVLVDLPTVNDPQRIKKVISDWGKLELVHVISSPAPAPVQTYSTEDEAKASLNESGTANRRILPYLERDSSFADDQTQRRWVVVESPAIIEGNAIRTASAVRRTGHHYDITFTLNKSGADKFGTWTGANINEFIGVALNDEVTSVAYIKSQIFDSGEITGAFSKQAAEDLALILRAGALPARLQLLEEKIDKP